MKGLLYKDFYIAAKRFRIFAIVCAVFWISSLFTDILFFLVYPTVMICVLTVNLISYDEKSGWDKYVRTTPCTPSQIVSSKYLFNLLIMGGNLVCIALFQCGKLLYTCEQNWNDLWILLILLPVLNLLLSSVMLPAVFRYGIEKGTLIYFITVVVLTAALCLVSGFDETVTIPYTAIPAAVYAAAIFAVIGLFLLSWKLSIVLYRRRA